MRRDRKDREQLYHAKAERDATTGRFEQCQL